ncbi:LexA family transcriptional regulator [Chitinophaga silvatica]|uniref:LexA family transcriptional regulator n=1 Tax=Chitinophaga silvatica TaxID=2282649 RepID=A0A3E1YHY6_9BACT|nr:LexA family transcriptional regulator [Chitinophaga silvatica]RFS26977.1 LexA family transcriptional regulator [Chitinophaga silvatica]
MGKQPFYWASNLKWLRNKQQLSQLKLAVLLGLNRNKITSQESGKTKNPRMEDLVLIADYFQIPIDYFIKTDLSIFPDAELETIIKKQLDLTGKHIRVLPITVDQQNEENMEYVPAKAKAGYRNGFTDPDFIANLPKFSLPELPRGKTIRMFPISGDSMEPIPHGSHVIAQYQQDWSDIKNNTPCVLILKGSEEDIVFKIVGNHIRKNGTLTLQSLNPAYPEMEVSIGDVLEIWTFIGYLSKEIPNV